MVELAENRLDRLFHALADPTRRAMIESLGAGERSVGELAGPFSMTLAGASKHVKVLEDAGLVDRERQGRRHVCHLVPERLGEAHAWLARYERFWAGRLDALESALRAEDAAAPGDTSRRGTRQRRRGGRR